MNRMVSTTMTMVVLGLAGLPDAAQAQAVSSEEAKQRVITGLSASAPYKTAAVEYFNAHQRFPLSMSEVGLSGNLNLDAVQRIEYLSADPQKEIIIRILYGSWAYPANVLLMRGEAVAGGIRFACGVDGTTVNPLWLPPACLPPRAP